MLNNEQTPHPKEIKHHKKLNQRQQVLKRELIKTGGNLQQAGLNAGYSPSYVNSGLSKIQENPVFKREYESNLIKALKKKGIDDDKLSEVVNDGLRAMRLRTFKGEVLGEEPDNFIRHRFLETILKVRGDFAPEQINVNVGRQEAEKAFQERIERMRGLQQGKNKEENTHEDDPLKIGDVTDCETT